MRLAPTTLLAPCKDGGAFAHPHGRLTSRRVRDAITEKKGEQSNINLTLIDTSMFAIV
jgi:hypothetical protein